MYIFLGHNVDIQLQQSRAISLEAARIGLHCDQQRKQDRSQESSSKRLLESLASICQ